jgi:hypothetical protein
MAYNSIINTTSSAPNAAPLVPIEYYGKIIEATTAQSVAKQLFLNMPMGSATLSVPVLDSLPEAYWVSNAGTASPGTHGSAGTYGALSQTSNLGWKGVVLQAQELAVDVPIAKVTLADSMFPIEEVIVPKIAEALALKLDRSVFFDQESPFSAPALVPAAVAAGNVFTAGTASKENGSLANDIAQLFSLVEAGSGFPISGAVASLSMKAIVRNARTTFGSELSEINTDQWYDTSVNYRAIPGGWPQTPATGLKATVTEASKEILLTTGTTATLAVGDTVTGTGIPTGSVITSIVDSTHFKIDNEATATGTAISLTELNPVAVVGDFTQACLGIRQDLSIDLQTQGIVQDGEGNIVINLNQQGAINLHVTARFGYAVANSVTRYNQNDATRFPFAVLLG